MSSGDGVRDGGARADGARDDAALVHAVHGGDDEALAELLIRYRPFARSKARGYFLVGADRDDLVQEGMIGLYKAVRDFDAGRESSFRGFAELCITRQIVTAVRAATRHKHTPLNNYVSFSVGDSDGESGEDGPALDRLATQPASDPCEQVISAERIRELQRYVDEVLSDLETQVLRMHLEGKSYAEMATLLRRQAKSVDNALQRVKRKLEEHLRSDADSP